MKANKFLTLAILIVVLRPWLWKVLNYFIHFPYSREAIIVSCAILISVLFIRYHGKIWHLIICILFIDPVGSHISEMIMFEIHYANNDILMHVYGNHPDEMYRDYNSNFELMMNHVTLKYWIIGIMKRIGLYSLIIFSIVFIGKRIAITTRNE